MLQITSMLFIQGDNIRLPSPYAFCTFSFFLYFWYLNLNWEFVHIRITTKCAVTLVWQLSATLLPTNRIIY